MADRLTYPFEPKSNAYLRSGQFWGVPLSDGRFACGRVLGVPPKDDDFLWLSSKIFVAGLMDWVGDAPPTAESIAGTELLAQGLAHVKAIRENGGLVLGIRHLELDGIIGLREVTHRGGGTVYLYEGLRRLRPATREEAATLPVFGTWGYHVVRVLAEARFVSSG